MYKITVKYKDGKEVVFIKHEYDKACVLVNELWSKDTESIHLEEIK